MKARGHQLPNTHLMVHIKFGQTMQRSMDVIKTHCQHLILILIVFAALAPSAFAQQQYHADFNHFNHHWTVMGGYGVSHKGLGATDTKVETIDIILRYGRFLTGELGSSWYKGRHEILIEVPFRTVVHPETAIMTGINFLAAWNFTAGDSIIPYIMAGGGPVYTNLDIPGLGAELNYSYQGGLGLHYFVGNNRSINVNYRLHHMSNAGTADPNEPLNSSRILIGITFFR
jgi:opacity protein-like surface antigen